MGKDEKTLREIFLEKQRAQKKRRAIFIILGGAVLMVIGIFSVSYREQIVTKYHSVRDSITQKSKEQDFVLNEGETSPEERKVEERSDDLDLFNELEDSREDGNSEEIYWEYEGEVYDTNEDVGYKKEWEDDESYYEQNQRLMEELWGDEDEDDYEYNDDYSIDYDPMYEEPQFDMNACMGECEDISSQYYSQCINSYNKYMQSAEDAYNDSLNSCIANLGRYDSACEEDAQELYDLYMSSPIASQGENYCLVQSETAYNDCYQSHCVDNPLNN
jgi:hypothetical protein